MGIKERQKVGNITQTAGRKAENVCHQPSTFWHLSRPDMWQKCTILLWQLNFWFKEREVLVQTSSSCQVNFCLIISSLSKAKGDQTCCLNVDHLVNSTICPLIQLTLLHKRPVQSPHMLCYCLYSTNAHLTVLCFIIHLLFHIINDFVVVVVVLPVCHLPLLLWTSQSSFHFTFEPLSLP